MRMVNAIPALATADVVETARFYQDALGFDLRWLWTTEDPIFGCVARDGIEIFLAKQPELAPHVAGLQQTFGCDDIDALYEEHVRRGAPITDPIADKPWGIREYFVRDPNGYRLRFGGPIVHSREVRGCPDGIRIVDRLPSPEEYGLVETETNPEFALTPMKDPWLSGVVAIDTQEDRVIGMALASGDGVHVIYIQNVAVTPPYQGKGIGSALMKSLMAQLSCRYPSGTLVMLITGKPSFYAPFGFRNNGGVMVANL